MGYESNIIVAEVFTPYRDDGRSSFRPIATFDLSKMGYPNFSRLLAAAEQAGPPRKLYWYPQLASGPANPDAPEADQRHFGDCELETDPYGKPPTELNLRELIEALEADDDGYRRIAPVVAALKVYADQLDAGFWRPERFTVLHLGH